MANKILAPIFNWFGYSLFALPDFKKEFNPQASLMLLEHEQHLKNVAALKLLEKKEKQYKEDMMLINDIRKAILYRYCRK